MVIAIGQIRNVRCEMRGAKNSGFINPSLVLIRLSYTITKYNIGITTLHLNRRVLSSNPYDDPLVHTACQGHCRCPSNCRLGVPRAVRRMCSVHCSPCTWPGAQARHLSSTACPLPTQQRYIKARTLDVRIVPMIAVGGAQFCLSAAAS